MITPDDAFAILRILAQLNPKMKEKIEALAIEYLKNINIKEIASQVYLTLNLLEVEELWDRSGATRNGYIDPVDMAWDMFEEAMTPFLDELKKYRNLSMQNQAMCYCMGILKGIYKFEKESLVEYKDWAPDVPSEFFHQILDDWRKSRRSREDIKKMEEFIEKDCPDWAR